jgi:4-amino-4-deoxy-L-arabinose transferase-like glycosyltransferase
MSASESRLESGNKVQTSGLRPAVNLDRLESSAGPWPVLRNREFRLAALLVLLLAAVLYVVAAASWPKFSRAEVFFAECAREMLGNGNYITSPYHSKFSFDKPVLSYWLILSSFKMFGASHLTARIPTIAAALATVAATGALTAVSAGAVAGLIAAMTLGSSFLFFSFASLCMPDMLLTFFDLATLALLYAGTRSERQRGRLWWLAALSMSLAFLTKGWVGIVLPATTFILYLRTTSQLAKLRPLNLAICLATIVLLVSPWLLAAWRANGAGALANYFVNASVEPFNAAVYDSHKPFWFVPLAFASGFLPWSALLPVCAWSFARQWQAGVRSAAVQRDLLCWLWVVVGLLVFSFTPAKCDYYALPVFPAAASLCGIYLGRWIAAGERPAATAGWGLSFCFIACGIISCLVLPGVAGTAQPIEWLLMPAALVMSGALMSLCMYYKQTFKTYALAYTGVCLAALGFVLQILPAIVSLEPVLSYIDIARNAPAETRLGMYRGVESWLDEVTFQTGRKPVRLADEDEMARFLSDNRASLLIVPKDKFEELPPEVYPETRIVGSRPFIAHSISPGFAIERHGALKARFPLLLVARSH